MVHLYINRDSYSRGKLIDLAKEKLREVINKNVLDNKKEYDRGVKDGKEIAEH
jgi:hypothetical protein